MLPHVHDQINHEKTKHHTIVFVHHTYSNSYKHKNYRSCNSQPQILVNISSKPFTESSDYKQQNQSRGPCKSPNLICQWSNVKYALVPNSIQQGVRLQKQESYFQHAVWQVSPPESLVQHPWQNVHVANRNCGVMSLAIWFSVLEGCSSTMEQSKQIGQVNGFQEPRKPKQLSEHVANPHVRKIRWLFFLPQTNWKISSHVCSRPSSMIPWLCLQLACWWFVCRLGSLNFRLVVVVLGIVGVVRFAFWYNRKEARNCMHTSSNLPLFCERTQWTCVKAKRPSSGCGPEDPQRVLGAFQSATSETLG